MTSQEQTPSQESAPLLDIIDRALDKGLIIDAWVRVPIVGLDVLTVEARMFVASCERYLQLAEAVAQTSLMARPAFPPTETLHVQAAPQGATVEDDAAQVSPLAAGATQAGRGAVGISPPVP